MSDLTDFDRAVDFLWAMQDAGARRTERWRWGTAFFDDRFPIKWDLNFLRLEDTGPDVTALAVAEEAHRVQGAAGLQHRKVRVYDPETAVRLRPWFEERGWDVLELVIMSAREAPVGADSGTREATRADLTDTFHRWWMMEQEDPERAETLASSIAALAPLPLRYFALDIEGTTAGWCELFSQDGVGQIEGVCTFPEWRNRGVARAVVDRALRESMSDGNDLTFLVADQNDWPKELYLKLGFAAVGTIYEFLVRPD